MSDVKNSEILFIYEASNTNPNGDPDNENRPRTDSRGFAEVTDLRLKRFIRDYMEQVEGKEIVIRPDVEITETKEKKQITRKAGKMSDLINFAIQNYKQKHKNTPITCSADFLKAFKDIAYFGVVTGDAEDYLKSHYYGAVQFQYGRSFNKVEIKTQTISPVMETLGVDQRLEYALIGFYGVVNAKTAQNNQLEASDIKMLDQYIVNSVPQMSVKSRSKIGHNSLLYVRIEYEKGFNPSDLRKFVALDKTEGIYSTDDYSLNINRLNAYLKVNDAKIRKVYVYHDKSLKLTTPIAVAVGKLQEISLKA